MKLNKMMNNNFLVIAAVIAVAVIICRMMKKSQYMPVKTSCGDQEPGSLFGGECKMDCVPGEENGAYYTKNLSPCGKCGLQKKVADYASCSLTD